MGVAHPCFLSPSHGLVVAHPSLFWMGGRHKRRRTRPSVLAFALAGPSAIPLPEPARTDH